MKPTTHFQAPSALNPVRRKLRGFAAAASFAVAVGLVCLSVTLPVGRLVSTWLWLSLAATMSIVMSLHIRYLVVARSDHRESECRFQQIAGNIDEAFWMLDLETRQLLYTNQAWKRVTGLPEAPVVQPLDSYLNLVHPDDRERIAGKLQSAAVPAAFSEKFRILRPGLPACWLWVRGFPVRSTGSEVRRIAGTAQDITAEKAAQNLAARRLIQTEAAWSESDALRRATLAVTQEIRMDDLLDRILQCIKDLVPCQSARVHLLEVDSRFFLAHECTASPGRVTESLDTIDVSNIAWIQPVVAGKHGVLIEDTFHEQSWRSFKGAPQARSWLAVPLRACGQTLGFISLADDQPCRFTKDHLRRAELLALPAAIAIQNARLYERAEIYAEQLQKRRGRSHPSDSFCRSVAVEGPVSELSFREIYRSSPIASSIATLDEGQILAANAAFQRRYGFSETQSREHNISEHALWENSWERAQIAAEIRSGRAVDNFITRFRCSSGEFKLTSYSAVALRINEKLCIVGTFVDPLAPGTHEAN